MKKTIIIAGNIGVGKSTLLELLGKRLGWHVFPEPISENPYIQDFYRSMPNWSFHSQIYFLAHKLRIQQEISRCPESLLQDRSIYEDAEIFARNLFNQGLMTERDYKTYRSLYLSLCEYFTPPDLVIYLRASVDTLIKRISSRNRDYEQKINPDYLSQLNVLYEEWMTTLTFCPVLTVPADNLDYVVHSSHLDLIVEKVRQKLSGNEEMVFDVFDLAKVKDNT